VITAGFLASAAAAVAGGPGNGIATAGVEGPTSPNSYFADSLFRSDRAERVDASVRVEANLILGKGIQDGDMSAADRTYLAQLVSARTGLNQTEAQRRVSAVFDDARRAADNARKVMRVGVRIDLRTCLRSWLDRAIRRPDSKTFAIL
jgi:hypothetical protein